MAALPTDGASGPAPDGGPGTVRLVLASRGDALTPHLSAALSERYQVCGRLDVELTRVQRALVGLVTVRPSKRAWAERFYKSGLGYRLRSRNAERSLAALAAPYDVVVQTHALFRLRGVPVVLYVDCTHAQSAAQWPPWNPLRGAALRRWYSRERAQYHEALHLFAFCTQTRDALVDHYGVAPDRVTVVGAGAGFLPASVPVRTGSPAGPTVLFIGNDFVRKGGDVLLRAFRLVRERVPDARLRIVGARHPVPAQPGVEVLGRIGDRDEVARLYQSASVFCLPSLYDPYPLVLLEAMAFALPCVTTGSCGIPEMVVDGETGVVVPAGDDDRLADALVELLLDEGRAVRMGSQGRRRVEERFRWSQVVERMDPALTALTAPAAVPRAVRR